MCETPCRASSIFPPSHFSLFHSFGIKIIDRCGLNYQIFQFLCKSLTNTTIADSSDDVQECIWEFSEQNEFFLLFSLSISRSKCFSTLNIDLCLTYWFLSRIVCYFIFYCRLIPLQFCKGIHPQKAVEQKNYHEFSQRHIFLRKCWMNHLTSFPCT